MDNTPPPDVGSWAEAVEQEYATPAIKRTSNATRIETVFEVIEGRRYKVETEYLDIKKRVPKVVADRKKWVKFGSCKGEPKGPQASSTQVAEEVIMQFTRNRAGEGILDAVDVIKPANTGIREFCRYCKSNEHWSTMCPYQELFGDDETEDKKETPETEKKEKSIYDRGQWNNVRINDNTCFVTNLSDEISETDLHDVFEKCGSLLRVFIPTDKITGLLKGYAFVDFKSSQDAARAIEQMDGYKMKNVVIHVESSRPNC